MKWLCQTNSSAWKFKYHRTIISVRYIVYSEYEFSPQMFHIIIIMVDAFNSGSKTFDRAHISLTVWMKCLHLGDSCRWKFCHLQYAKSIDWCVLDLNEIRRAHKPGQPSPSCLGLDLGVYLDLSNGPRPTTMKCSLNQAEKVK